MKHLWILNHYAQTPEGAGGTRHYSLARHLPEFGWKATVIAANTPYLGEESKVADGDFFVKNEGGPIFLWIKCPAYKGNGLGRIGNMLYYSLQTLKPATQRMIEKPDAIIGSSVHPFAALAAAIISIKYRIPFVFEVRDLWPETLISMGVLKRNGPVAIIMRILERWLYHRAVRIVTLLPMAGDYIASLGVSRDKVVWIPNGIEWDCVEKIPFSSRSLEDISQSGFTLMYFGAHGQANGLRTLLEAFRLLKDFGEANVPQIRLRLIGDGPMKSDLQSFASEHALTNVTFEPAVPKCAIPSLATEADAFVICVRKLPELYRFGISMNKIYDYLAAGKPIVIASDAVNNPITEASAGIAVPAESPRDLADAILRLATLGSDQRQKMGENGRSYAMKNNTFRILSGKLAKTLDELITEFVA